MYYDDDLTEEERQWGNPFGDALPENNISTLPAPGAVKKKKSGSAVNGLEARRGMALKINVMLAQGQYSAEEIAIAIIPETQHLSKLAAVAKLQSHLRNLRRHGGKVTTSENGHLLCTDVKLPASPQEQDAARYIA